MKLLRDALALMAASGDSKHSREKVKQGGDAFALTAVSGESASTSCPCRGTTSCLCRVYPSMIS